MPTASPDIVITKATQAPNGEEVQMTDQHGTDLHRKVEDALTVMGHPGQTVPEGERPVFGGADAVEVVGNAVINGITDRFYEPTLETGERVSPSRRFRRWASDRMNRLMRAQKK